MPKIIIMCSGCGNELNVTDSYVDNMGDIVISVESCANLDCRDCSKCEDHNKYQELVAAVNKVVEGG